ncbi:MAG: RNA-binding protein [Bacteroidales bacterium]
MNIYVSNLNFRTTEESLHNLFAEYGEVTSAKIITDRDTGRSRGFGFVEMSDDSEGQEAISNLNETDFEGKTITVNIARPKSDRGNDNRSWGSRDGGRGRGGDFNRGGGRGGNGGGYGRSRY